MDSVIMSNKCFKSLANALTGFLAAFNMTIDNAMALTDVFDLLDDGVSMYTVVGNDTSVYPVAVSTQYGHRAIVCAIKGGGGSTVTFIFMYDGAIYICDAYTSPSGVTVGGWYQVTTTAVNAENTGNG